MAERAPTTFDAPEPRPDVPSCRRSRTSSTTSSSRRRTTTRRRGMGPVAPAAPPPPPPPPPQPAPQTGRSKKRARDGADETASERADRKSARERRRRAEVGEKFEELTKALGEAEERCAGSVPRSDAVSEGNRVDLLQRAIDVVRALTKACVDAKRAAAAAQRPRRRRRRRRRREPVRLVVVAQTSVSRAQLADLARRGDAWHSAFEQRDGGAVAAVAGAASTAATSFVVGDGRTPLPPGPPTPQHLIPAQAPVAATPPVRSPRSAPSPRRRCRRLSQYRTPRPCRWRRRRRAGRARPLVGPPVTPRARGVCWRIRISPITPKYPRIGCLRKSAQRS